MTWIAPHKKVASSTLRAQGKEPKANYVIIPAAGSLIGDVPSLKNMEPEELEKLVRRIIKEHGARKDK